MGIASRCGIGDGGSWWLGCGGCGTEGRSGAGGEQPSFPAPVGETEARCWERSEGIARLRPSAGAATMHAALGFSFISSRAPGSPAECRHRFQPDLTAERGSGAPKPAPCYTKATKSSNKMKQSQRHKAMVGMGKLRHSGAAQPGGDRCSWWDPTASSGVRELLGSQAEPGVGFGCCFAA